MVQELDTVVITRDLPERGIVAGDIGPGRNPDGLLLGRATGPGRNPDGLLLGRATGPGRNPDGLLLGSAAYPLERGVTHASGPLESA